MPESTAILQAARLLRHSGKTVVLTGAGVSTESGIPDFRGKKGLWSRFDPMEYGTIGAFRRDPHKVWRMLAELLDLVDARPNAGHQAMAELEEKGLLAGIITQNIDGLHRKAGSRRVVEFHGGVDNFSCLACGRSYPLAAIRQMPLPPLCGGCTAVLKPDVVFFDEQIPAAALVETEELLSGVDVLLVAGTSCQVVPASYIPGRVQQNGGRIIEINLEPVLDGIAAVTIATSFAAAMTRLLHALSN